MSVTWEFNENMDVRVSGKEMSMSKKTENFSNL